MPITVRNPNRDRKLEFRSVLRRLCLASAAALIFQLFYVGAQPAAAGLIPMPWDKLAHLAVYAAITALMWIGTAGRMPLKKLCG